MAQLIVRRVDQELVSALRLRAARNNRSAEAEHRELLRDVLIPRSKDEDFKTYLLTFPDSGAATDFRRPPGRPRRIPRLR